MSESSNAAVRVACDVGGTFTDLMTFDEVSGAVLRTKVPTTPRAPDEGLLRACEDAEVTFIDELAFQRIWLGRGTLKRRYRFEFYRRGDRRYSGYVDMHGQRVAHIEMEPYPV